MPDSPLENSQALPPGTRLEEFLIERVLGAGGFGITYLARDTALGRQVVIKENLPVQFAWRDPNSFTVAPRHTTGEDADNFAWSLENFSKEAAMLASLDHPGIVRVHRSFRAFGTAYFVMPFVEGATLDERARQRESGLFSENELRGMLQRILGALGYLHDRGIYHRDLKPGNILITHEGIPVLIDFGSARQKLSERSMTVVESPGYTPFEQLQSRGNVGPWSDLYALAATLAKIITGEAPPKATDRAFDDPWVPLSDRTNLNEDYSSVLLTSVDRAFAARPGDRWQDAAEWRVALAVEVQEAPIAPQTDSPPRSAIPASPLASGDIGDEVRFSISNGEEIVVKYVPGGRFQMGSPPGEAGRGDDEDQVWVSLSSHYWMADTEVTQGQWKAVMGSNPSHFKEKDWKKLPVENVSWNDAQEFINKLNSESPPGAGWKWALPTEAQWERACRGGTTTATAFGDSLSSRQANFNGKYPYGKAQQGPDLQSSAVVKSYYPNTYGLYDMHGNMWEWCEDAYQRVLPEGEDPLVSIGSNRVIRGGGWVFHRGGCRSASRHSLPPDIRLEGLGFRLTALSTRRGQGTLYGEESQPQEASVPRPPAQKQRVGHHTSMPVPPHVSGSKGTASMWKNPVFTIAIAAALLMGVYVIAGLLMMDGGYTLPVDESDLFDKPVSLAPSEIGTPSPPMPTPEAGALQQNTRNSSLANGEIGDEQMYPIREGEEIVVKYVPGGRFQMGSPPRESERGDNEDQVWVTLSNHFWMAETEVTQGQWVAVMGRNPSDFRDGEWKKLPVESVSWNDAQSFITKLNTESPPGVGWTWALPTEAQWERACRGGTTTATAFGDSLSSHQANFDGNYPYGGAERGQYLQKTVSVKSYLPNAYGLYDMHGNVWEWCADAYQDALPGGEDPLASARTNRVFRGGSWNYDGRLCRSSYRVRGAPDDRIQFLGFRLAAVPAGRSAAAGG